MTKRIAQEEGREAEDGGRSAGDDESEKERLSRKLAELLEELRVALPGVQVLFAFLLTLPFASRFERIDALDKDVYFGTFIAAALSSVFLIAPSAYHRMRWRFTDVETLEEKRRMLITSGRLAVTGLVFLGIAIPGVSFLIGHVLFGLTTGAVVAAVVAGAVVWFWYGIPLTRRAEDPNEPIFGGGS